MHQIVMISTGLVYKDGFNNYHEAEVYLEKLRETKDLTGRMLTIREEHKVLDIQTYEYCDATCDLNEDYQGQGALVSKDDIITYLEESGTDGALLEYLDV